MKRRKVSEGMIELMIVREIKKGRERMRKRGSLNFKKEGCELQITVEIYRKGYRMKNACVRDKGRERER